MIVRDIALVVTLLLSAAPLAAQQRGTLEFGGFANNTAFDESLSTESGWGAGGRVGAFLSPRLSIEVEGSGVGASRSQGSNDITVGVYSARLLGAPFQFGKVALLVGAGGDHTDTEFLKSYGFHALLGARVALTDALALRVGWTEYYLVNGDATNRSLHVGFSAYRSPALSSMR